MPQSSHGFQIAPAGEGAPATGRGGETHAASNEGREAYKLGDIPSPGLLFINGLIVAAILILFAIAATRKLAAIPKKAWGAQNFGEFVVEAMTNFTRGIIGPGGERYVPLVGTLFFFILISNIWGLIPGFHSPTANLSTNLALGFIVFLYAQYVGIRSNGLGGYIKHFLGPVPFLAWLIGPVEVISECVKPFTLSMRLFGNIFGEDTIIVALATLGVAVLPKVPIVAVQFPVMLLALLTAFVQALVFALLTCIYISLQSHHDTEHEGRGPHIGHGHPGIEESGMVP